MLRIVLDLHFVLFLLRVFQLLLQILFKHISSDLSEFSRNCLKWIPLYVDFLQSIHDTQLAW